MRLALVCHHRSRGLHSVGGEVETSSSNRKRKRASKRQAARGGGLATESACGPAAGPILGGWVLRVW